MPFQNKIEKHSECICGLVFHLSDLSISCKDDVVPVPLKSVSIDSKIVNFVAEVCVTQTYVNVESHPIEAVYMFPIEEEAAVISFEAQVEKRIIATQVKEKEEARNDYDDAMKNKKTAILLEETQPDIFQIKLGQLKPNTEAKITIKYLTELPVEDGKIKLTVPTTIAPRYVPSNDVSEAASKIASIPYSAETPAPLSVTFKGVSPCKVKAIKSPSHDFKTNTDDAPNSHGQYTYTGELSIQTTDMDRDIVLYIDAYDNEERNKPIVFVENTENQDGHKGFTAMVSLVPNFELDDQLTELIFLVDRSGSMGGSSMGQAKKALELFLHSLPSDCYFNIWSFGSRYDALFPEGSEKYSDKSLNEALTHVKSMSADYGGTVIYDPLQDIFRKPCRDKRYFKQVFVLTDGEVSNTSSIISLVKKYKDQARVFTLGIGSGASRYLVKGVARAGGGTAVFANEREDLRAKVMEQLKNALQPAFSSIEISWDETMNEQPPGSKEKGGPKKSLMGYMKSMMSLSKDDSKKSVRYLTGQVPTKIPPIFDGTRLLAYHIYHQESAMPKTIKIQAESPSGSLKLDIDINEANILHEAGFVRKLAARKKIQELEESMVDNQYDYDSDSDEENEKDSKKEAKKAIIRLGIENSLASQYTSFIGIDQSTGKTLNEKPMSTREIKNQLTVGYGSDMMLFGGAHMITNSLDHLSNRSFAFSSGVPKMAKCSGVPERAARMRSFGE